MRKFSGSRFSFAISLAVPLVAVGLCITTGRLCGQAQTRFIPVENTALPVVSDYVVSMASGDLDGDGNADIVLGRVGLDILLLGRGDGTFVDVSSRLPPNGLTTSSLALGDVDGDGDLDIVVGTDRGKDRLFLNDGKARFTDVPNHVEGGATGHIALADLDGDKDLDLLVGGTWNQSNFIAWNDGKGKFTRAAQTLPRSTAVIEPHDVDNDGDVDVLLTSGGRLLLLLNDGKGRLTDVSSTHVPSTAVNATFMTAGDVDRDGDVDVVLDRYGAGNILCLNDGKGKFTDVSATQMPQFNDYFGTLRLVDLTGDKAPELVQASTGNPFQGGDDRIFLNNGKGTFTDASAKLGFKYIDAKINAILDLDADNDGDRDVLFGGYPGSVRLFLNDGRGGLTRLNAPFLERDLDPTTGMTIGDIDGDGDLDFICNSGLRLKVYINDGRGRFEEQGMRRIVPQKLEALAVLLGDVDVDGDLDLLTSGDRLFLNDGSGFFKDASTRLPKDNFVTWDFALGDVDGDGDLDLVLGKQQAQNRLYLNNGKGAFTDVTATQMPVDSSWTMAVSLGDVDGDGDLDLAVGNSPTPNQQGGTDFLYLNDGKGRFTRAGANLTNYTEITADLEFGDLDGDGDLDLVTATTTLTGFPGRDRLYFNNGKGQFTDVSATHFPLMREATFALALADVDGDGDMDVIHANDVDFLNPSSPQNVMFINDGHGKFTNQTKLWLPVRYDFTHAVVVGDLDGDRDVDILFGNTNLASLLINNTLFFNQTRHLIGPDLVRTGRTHTMRLVSWTGTASNLRLAVPLLSSKPARIPLPPLGVIGIDPALSVSLGVIWLKTDPAFVSYKISVPASPALSGLVIYNQALIATLSQPQATRLTNPVAHRIY